MISLKGIAVSLLCLAATAFAQVSTSCSSDVCVSVNIPSTGQDTYFHVKAPQSAGWAGFGIGTQMKGALIFVMYPSTTSGKVTISPRIGAGHFMPEYNPSIKITNLPGTNITDGIMYATFVCSNCRSWSGGSIDVTSTAQSFLWAIGGSGNGVTSSSVSATINQHQDNGFLTIDLTKATGGNGGDNVFSSSSSNSGSGSGSGFSFTSSNASGGNSLEKKMNRVLIAHGITTTAIAFVYSMQTLFWPRNGSRGKRTRSGLKGSPWILSVLMGLSWVILFPFGAAFIRFLNNRVPNAFLLHVGFQVFNTIVVCIALGLGVWYSNYGSTHFLYCHQFFGVIIVGLLFFQIFLGIMHHLGFLKYRRRTPVSYGHIWTGRTIVICGIINCGLGLHLAHAKKGWITLYSVFAVLSFVAYVVTYGLVMERRRRRDMKTYMNGKS